MENLSHSRHPNRSASKVISNGGFLAKTLYDDVYGGPPKFGGLSSSSSSLSPRLEDYGEIFGAFHASRASSIPVLEVPAADDDDNEEFFDVRSSGFDYSEVFGGFDGLDFAVAYDDLVKQPYGGDGGSSDEAWTPAESGSLSGESNHSVKNQSFTDGDPYYSFDGRSEFGISYNKVHQKSNKESLNGRAHANPVTAAPGYRYMPDEITPVQHTNFDNQSLPVTDDRKFNMYSNVEMVNEKHLRKTVSHPPNGSSAGQAYGDSHRPEKGYGTNGSRHKEPFITISDINLRTQPSHLPPPCRPPPIVDDNSGDSGRLSSNSNTVSSDERTGDSSPPFFDVEVDASSSAAVSAAAMKEAMEKARVQLRSAKELMQRKKEGYRSRSKSRSKKEIKEEEVKVGKVADGSSCKKDDRVRGTSEREDSRLKFAVSEETQKVLKKVREDPESLGDEKSSEAAENHVQEKHGKGSWSSQGSFKINEASEWQEATQYFELVALDDTKKAFEQANKDQILVQSTKGHEQRQKDKATLEVLEQQETDKKLRAVVEVHDPEDLEKKHRGLEECNARSKDAKESRRRKEHEKKVKVTQETFEKGENEMSSRVGKLPAESEKQRGRSVKSDKHENMAEVEGKESKFNVENAMQQKDNEAKLQENDKSIRIEERHKESRGVEGIENRQETLEQEENERRLIEAFKQAENEKRLKEVLEKEENEKRLKEALEQAENEKRLKKTLELQENEKKLKETLERENKRRRKEAAQREENEKRLKEALEKEKNEKRLKEENEKRLKKALELQENEKKLKEALERENKKRQKEAAQREENEKRLKEALELEEYQKRQKDAREREENERRLKMAHSREQQYAIKILKESQEKAFKQAEIQQKLDEASVSEETEKNIKVADDREDVEVLNKTQKGTERNENVQELRSVKKTHLHMEVEDHKVSDETCNQDCNENSQPTQIARNHDENSETMKESQEVHAHEENGEKKTDNKNSDTQSGPEVVEPVNVALDLEYKASAKSQEELEDGEKWFRRKDANECLPLDSSVKKAREEIRAEPKVRKRELGGVETKNGPVDEKFKASGLSGLAQGGTESGKGQFRMDDAYESIPFVNFVKKAVEASSGFEKPQPINSTSQKDSDHETQKMECAQEWKEREKDSKQVHASSNQEENLAAEPVKEFVDNRRKTEAAHPAMAEINNRKSSQQVNASQAPEWKVKNLKENPLNGEKEKERLKRERELENDRLRKIEEEREREREREKDRMAVDRATLEARDWAYVEARERAERVALERATADARQRAMAEARERLEKACAEAREKSLAGKAAMEARLKAERAAVERATAEARERAAEKLMAERASFETRERVQRSVSDKFSASSRNNGLRHCSSSSDLQDPQKSRHPYSTAYGERYEGVEGESAQRCKARLERHARTAERAAKALAEKNMRDLLAQREQAERNRLAETLDADVKRWSSGKEGNLRALLSTLQYILGPDSGWLPIPLTEVITAAAVKRAYRKATLCVHPDKLQQRGASIHQKYICEKVFDLLKEAWNKFNSEER
ncbi:auxilin-like protein 1 [Rosa rugosa]|uniref:auxilin-like protein 1 n=1 Tax=Rosa rugosa TaxID=74645 RepID=UPI002B414614|nr:auxilin-like protein 1 [Rosa rugosa]